MFVHEWPHVNSCEPVSHVLMSDSSRMLPRAWAGVGSTLCGVLSKVFHLSFFDKIYPDDGVRLITFQATIVVLFFAFSIPLSFFSLCFPLRSISLYCSFSFSFFFLFQLLFSHNITHVPDRIAMICHNSELPKIPIEEDHGHYTGIPLWNFARRPMKLSTIQRCPKNEIEWSVQIAVWETCHDREPPRWSA